MTAWRWAVLVVVTLAGFVFVAGAVSSGGSDLRPDRRTQLTDLVAAAQERTSAQAAQVTQLRDEVDTAAAAVGPVLTPAQRSTLAQVSRAAGYTTVRGPGITVTLTDAPVPIGGPPSGFAPDDYVVHQQDVEAVVNSLWSAGAQAVTVMDQRLISTSAVRCVGNTLILQGRVYSPPYVIAAVGAPAQLEGALEESNQVDAYRRRAQVVGLGYLAEPQRIVVAQAYDGAAELQHASVPTSPGGPR